MPEGEGNIRLSESSEIFLEDPEISLRLFRRNLGHDIETEVQRIISEVKMIGEGNAAKVFPVDRAESPCFVCAKIARHNLMGSDADLSIYEHIGLKHRDREPKEEFDLQDQLWKGGFRNIPCPIAYVETTDRKVIVMEQIEGYTLEKIAESGARIANPGWRELVKLVNNMHSRGIVHRDLKTANIMLRTDQKLEPGVELSGEIVIIDFGRSKYYGGSEPEAEDYIDVIGGQALPPHANDKNMVKALEPTRDASSIFMKSK